MFGSALDALEHSIDELHAQVRAIETEDVSGPAARRAISRIEVLRERLEHVAGCLASDLAARNVPQRDGARSMADWLAARTGQRRQVTGSRMHLATKLRAMPGTDAALGRGEITHCHATVLARALNPRTTELFARDEALLVGAAKKLTADQLAKVVAHWLAKADPDGPEPGAEDGPDTFHLSQTMGGRLKGNFDLGGELAILVKAILDETTEQLRRQDGSARAADPTDPRIDEPTSQRRARALGVLLERGAASKDNPARRLPLLNIHTTIETLTRTGDPLDWKVEAEEAWRSAIPMDLLDLWACDCFAGRIILDAEGLPLDVGRAERLATPAQRRAVFARDGAGCGVPGCTAPAGWCSIHHIRWWTRDAGPSDLDNFVGTCVWHHTRIHEGKLFVEMVDGRPQFRLPDGTVLHDPRAGPDG